ncbi:MAG TPA: DinB family protein [Phycisphaerae bacterium]|nr:DinB family protein [Phycisphaerae bacterium]
MTAGELLAEQLAETRRWTLLLLADFAGDDWTYQPGPGLQHALWLGGHLASSQNTLIFQRCLDRNELDPAFARKFAPGNAIKPAGEFAWPEPKAVLEHMAQVHEKTLAAVRGMSDAVLAEPAFGKDGAKHPHYSTKLGAVSHADRHEAFHAGQIALIRRLVGKSFLR